jgi:hypothetical protein
MLFFLFAKGYLLYFQYREDLGIRNSAEWLKETSQIANKDQALSPMQFEQER